MLSEKARTSFALLAAGGAIVASIALTQRRPQMDYVDIGTEAVYPPPTPVSAFNMADDGMILTAKLQTANILTGSHEQNMAVTITAPSTKALTRPPLSLAVVIDRSGSMTGKPLADAKTSAEKLVDRLDEGDAFTVITYSSGDETVMPMSRATPANKIAAREAIERIYEDGGTCISCGMERAARELAHTPVIGGLQRMVLISDGQANTGLFDRGELAQLAIDTAAKGVSISTVGVGLDFDEVTMANLAQVGRGNYYFVEKTDDLVAMFDKELGGLAETFAADVRLTVADGSGVAIAEAYGYPMTRTGTGVIIPVADLRAGESRKVVLRLTVDAQRAGTMAVSQVRLDWRRVSDAQYRKAMTTAMVEVVADATSVAASVDRDATLSIEQAQTAKALDEATVIYERDGYEAARRVIDARVQSMRSNGALAAPEAEKLESLSNAAIRDFSAAPNSTKAKKTTRESAYQLAR